MNKLSAFSLSWFVIAVVRSFWLQTSLEFSDMEVVDRFIFVGGLIGGILFWFLMLSDFFRNVTLRYKIVWGFSLIFLSWLAAIVYYFVCYLPKKHKVVDQHSNAE